MPLLTTDEIREHVDTDLSDTALQRLIDDADAEIVTRFGAHAEDADGEPLQVTERFVPMLGERYLFPSRPVDEAAVISVVRSTIGSTDEPVAVDAVEYVVEDPRRIRIGGWGWSRSLVAVTYTPVSDTPRRVRVLIDLVRLALRYEAAQSSRMGDASINHVQYEREREQLLSRLSRSLGVA